MRAVDAAELLGARMDMHELRARPRNIDQRVALRGNFAEPAADQQDEIGVLDARDQLGIGADAEVAGVAGMQRIEQRQAPIAGRDRQREALGELRASRRAPARDQRLPPRMTSGRSRLRQQLFELRHLRLRPARSRPARTPARPATATRSVSMSSGRPITTGPGRPLVAV